jgi:hypothetical protein
MANFALIENGIVINCIIAEDQESADLCGQAIEFDEKNPAYIGGSYDGKLFYPIPVQE